MNLTPGEQEWLSNHLGHEIHIDKDVYRSNDAILEVSKISRLLMVADSGKMAQYAGKPLSDIAVEGKGKQVSNFLLLILHSFFSLMLNVIDNAVTIKVSLSNIGISGDTFIRGYRYRRYF